MGSMMGGGLGVGGLGANSMMSGGLSGGKGTVTLAESNPGSVVALDPTVQLDTYGGSVSFHGQIETIQTMSTDLVSQVLNQPGQNRVLIIDGGGSRSDGTCLLDGTMAESAIRNGQITTNTAWCHGTWDNSEKRLGGWRTAKYSDCFGFDTIPKWLVGLC